MRYVFLFCLLISSAFADVTSPSGPVLIERERTGGYVPEEIRGYVEKISIYANGEVFTSFKSNYNAPWEHRLLANLSDGIMNVLNHVVNNAEPGQLEFPDSPPCTDVPVTTYSVINPDGGAIVFAKNIACKMGYTQFVDGYELQKILDGFASFDYLGID